MIESRVWTVDSVHAMGEVGSVRRERAALPGRARPTQRTGSVQLVTGKSDGMAP